MKKQGNSWVALNRNERRGAIALAVLCLIIGLAPQYLPKQNKSVPAEIARFEAMLETLAPEKTPEGSPPEVVPVPFNPNTADSATLLALGFPSRGIRNLLAYRRAGGQFREPEDLAKIYGLDESFLDRLGPFLRMKEEKAVATLPKLQPFPFDPNQISGKDLKKMGIPDGVASTWLKYRNKGGRFTSPTSLKKVYGLNEDLYRQLKEFIQFEDSTEVTEKVAPDPYRRTRETAGQLIDINTAGLEEWEGLYGIGPVLATRIIRFRDAMGGFTSIAQVADTYGLPDSTFQHILPHLSCDRKVKQWPVNRLSADSLMRHPYLNASQARSIVAFRDQHGPFSGLDGMRRIHSLPDSLLLRLEPYLDFTQ